MDKKDYEEIEKWKKQKMNYVETYGVDIFHKKKEEKKYRITEKLFNFFYRTAKTILIILIFVIIIGTFIGLFWYYDYINSKLHADPVDTISSMYDKKVKIVSKDIDENKNGTYILTTKENKELEFNAIVNWKELTQDYSDRCQKYYYNKWENPDKNKINTIETYENDGKILKYEQYIKIENKEEITDAVKLIQDFIKSAGEFFFPDWNIYLLVDNQKIYLFTSIVINEEQIINDAENRFEQIKNNEIINENNNNNEQIIYEDMIIY